MHIIQHVFTVRDDAAGSHLHLGLYDTMALAMRGFLDETATEGSPMHRHPEDYNLYYLGTWDKGTALFDLVECPMPVMNAKTGPRVDPNDPRFEVDNTDTCQRQLHEVRNDFHKEQHSS